MEQTCFDQLAELLRTAQSRRASDVRLAGGRQTTIWVDGRVRMLDGRSFTAAELSELLEVMLDEERRSRLETEGEVEFSRDVEGVCRVRGHAFHQQGGYALALRLIPFAVPEAESLFLPQSVQKLASCGHGLVIAGGMAGSGVTTTMASLAASVLREGTRTVLTLERPVEYRFPESGALVIQREIGTDCVSYAAALSAAVRQKADVIMVGEIEDAETLLAAIAAAESGCLVFGAARGENAVSVLERLMAFIPPASARQIGGRLAAVLRAAVAQRLLPGADGDGRIAAFEVLPATDAVCRLIREEKFQQLASVLEAGKEPGLLSMDDAVFELYMKSRITAETAVAFACSPDEMKEKIRLF